MNGRRGEVSTVNPNIWFFLCRRITLLRADMLLKWRHLSFDPANSEQANIGLSLMQSTNAHMSNKQQQTNLTNFRRKVRLTCLFHLSNRWFVVLVEEVARRWERISQWRTSKLVYLSPKLSIVALQISFQADEQNQSIVSVNFNHLPAEHSLSDENVQWQGENQEKISVHFNNEIKDLPEQVEVS